MLIAAGACSGQAASHRDKLGGDGTAVWAGACSGQAASHRGKLSGVGRSRACVAGTACDARPKPAGRVSLCGFARQVGLTRTSPCPKVNNRCRPPDPTARPPLFFPGNNRAKRRYPARPAPPIAVFLEVWYEIGVQKYVAVLVSGVRDCFCRFTKSGMAAMVQSAPTWQLWHSSQEAVRFSFLESASMKTILTGGPVAGGGE